MWFALLATALATCSPEQEADTWARCWHDAAATELPEEQAKAFATQWKRRPREERALARDLLGTSDAAWHLGRALVLHGLDHSLAEAVLDAHTPQHDERLVWYTGQLADKVWRAWTAAEQRYVKEPTDPNRAIADAARSIQTVFHDHVTALLRTGGDTTKALERCRAYVGDDAYCSDIEAGGRTHNGW